MKLSEFVLSRTKGTGPLDWEYFATVSVTTGALWWKKTERRMMHRRDLGAWRWVDTGEPAPRLQAEALEYSYKARESLLA